KELLPVGGQLLRSGAAEADAEGLTQDLELLEVASPRSVSHRRAPRDRLDHVVPGAGQRASDERSFYIAVGRGKLAKGVQNVDIRRTLNRRAPEAHDIPGRFDGGDDLRHTVEPAWGEEQSARVGFANLSEG